MQSKHLFIIIGGLIILIALLIILILKNVAINTFGAGIIGAVCGIILSVIGLFIVLKTRFLSLKNYAQSSMDTKDYKPSSKTNNNAEINALKPLECNTKFSDIAGINEAKEELLEIVDFLKNPKKYKRMGISLPKGVLLNGSPGVGKTLIAKAMAGESGVPFFYQSAASFVEMYVGVGARRVRELFNAAKVCAPAIIFIDEIDAIGKKRGVGSNNNERESTLNQLLAEMDGFSDNSGVIVIGATNHIQALDLALLRSGRFDRKIFIELPSLNERIDILNIYLRNKSSKADTQIIAQKTAGFSGAMLANLVNEAAINALKRQAKELDNIDFEAVYNKIISGKKRLPLLDEQTKIVFAIYGGAKICYAIIRELRLQKASLFETSLLEANFFIMGMFEWICHIDFYLVGNAALHWYFKEGYGLFGNDFSNAKRLIDMGIQQGIFTSDDVSKFVTIKNIKQHTNQTKQPNTPPNTKATLQEQILNRQQYFLQSFILEYSTHILALASILLCKEKFDWEMDDINVYLSDEFLASNSPIAKQIRILAKQKIN